LRFLRRRLCRMSSSGMLRRVALLRFLQEPHGVISQKTPFFDLPLSSACTLAASWEMTTLPCSSGQAPRALGRSECTALPPLASRLRSSQQLPYLHVQSTSHWETGVEINLQWHGDQVLKVAQLSRTPCFTFLRMRNRGTSSHCVFSFIGLSVVGREVWNSFTQTVIRGPQPCH
jgi:hypothetical protein